MQQEKGETFSFCAKVKEEVEDAGSSKKTSAPPIPYKSSRSQPLDKIPEQKGLKQRMFPFSRTKLESDEDSSCRPVRALVLVFYRPPADLDSNSLLNVLLVPGNVRIGDVVRYRKRLHGNEHRICIPPHCKLFPQQEYTLSTCPDDDSVLVEPTTAEFDSDHYGCYIPSFQVTLKKNMALLKLILRDIKSSHSVWEGQVFLFLSGVQRSFGQSALNLPPNKRLFEIRSRFIDDVSEPVLKSLLDKLLERTVISDYERKSADKMRKRKKACFVFNTVMGNSGASRSEIIDTLRELDPVLFTNLGLFEIESSYIRFLPQSVVPEFSWGAGGAEPRWVKLNKKPVYGVPWLTGSTYVSERPGAGSPSPKVQKGFMHKLRRKTSDEPRSAKSPLFADSEPQETLDSFQGTKEASPLFNPSSSSEEMSPQILFSLSLSDQAPSTPSFGADIHVTSVKLFGLNFKPSDRIPGPQDHPFDLYDSSTVSERSRVQPERSSVHSESESGADVDAEVELDAAVTAVSCSLTNTQPTQIQTFSSGPSWTEGLSGPLPRSHSSPSLSHMTSAENQTLTRAQSLPDLQLNSSCEQFTPDITADEDHETYRLQCSSPGLYQCSVTGLVFHMEGEGDVVYRTVPWNRKLLSQHHMQPAGPLFDMKCEQQSVCQLHLPHCEIRSTGGADFLSVAHLDEEGVEFIVPHKITETHTIINITGFSAFGNIKDEDSPPDPVRALVLLFYKPPADPDPNSLLNVLMLPRNVLIPDVVRYRKKLIGDEHYIEKPSDCELLPQQEYTLSTCPEDDSVLVEPTKAKFHSDHYNNYVPSFQVTLEKTMTHLKLILKDAKSSHSVWESRVCLSSSGVQRSCGQSALNLPSSKRLFEIRSSFVEGASGPVLKSLPNKLLNKRVMTDSEVEETIEMKNRGDKACFVIDTVRRKGDAASSEMIEALCDLDPFFSEHLGLM